MNRFSAIQSAMQPVTSPDRALRTEGMSLKGKAPASDAQLNKIAQDFESVFLNAMLAPMFESTKVNPMFGGGQGEEMFRSLLVDEYAKAFSKNGGIGIAASVKSELIRLQGAVR